MVKSEIAGGGGGGGAEVKPKAKAKERGLNDATVKDVALYLLDCKAKHLLSLGVLLLAVAVAAVAVAVAWTCVRVSVRTDEPIDRTEDRSVVADLNRTEASAPTYWIYSVGGGADGGHLKHVHAVLARLGYRRVDGPGATTTTTDGNDWDLLWAHDYPFRKLYAQLRALAPHQLVNHLPGCGYMTSKVDLATRTGPRVTAIPAAFRLPEQKDELLEHAARRPGRTYVQKSNDHRNIRIRALEEIVLDVEAGEGTFVQEYVDRPFLVDGYKFDVGVYAIVTSVEPLRVYAYDGDVLFRYCTRAYHPFNASDPEGYVIGDDYRPTWQVPSLARLYVDFGHSMRASFDAYVRAQGLDPRPMWRKMHEAIANVALDKEHSIANVLKRFEGRRRNFFEMMRFDFVVDERLEVYLLEANMSPNLSSAHYPPNRRLYERVLLSLLSLVGVALRSHRHEDKGDIAVRAADCASERCRASNCEPIECQLCAPCLSDEATDSLVRAHAEHLARRDCKRIFPPPFTATATLEPDVETIDALSPENRLHYRWFAAKCQEDESWCR